MKVFSTLVIAVLRIAQNLANCTTGFATGKNCIPAIVDNSHAAIVPHGSLSVINPEKNSIGRNGLPKLKGFVFVFVILMANLFFGGAIFGQVNVGPNNATSGVNVTGIGTVAWTNPGNALANDNSFATIAVNNATSNYLQTSGYGFSIPSDATITGILVTIGRFQNTTAGGNDIRDTEVRLLKSGTVTGSNLAVTGTEWPTTEGAATYGSTSNLWGTTWTPAEINASNFGVALAVNSTNSRTGSVDYITVTVTYIPVSSTGVMQHHFPGQLQQVGSNQLMEVVIG